MGGAPKQGVPGDLRVAILGPLHVDGVPAEALGSRKARTLLKVLAVARGAPVSADRLVEICWGDDLPSKPADQVAVLVSRLRSALGRDRITRGPAGYTLHADWLDLDEAEALAAEAAKRMAAGAHAAARAAAGAALTLVRGPLLADEPDASWAEAERAAAARLVARLHHLRAEAALAAGDAVDAAEAAQRALDGDAYDEHALRLLMAAWSAAGRPASALAAYARVRARLAEDLGVDPSAETEAVHTAVLREQVVPGIVVGRRDGADLPGRLEELAALDAALHRAAAGVPEVVLVEGEPGIGKTALLGAWRRRAEGAGAVVLAAACEEYERSLPLQVVLDALAAHLRTYDRPEAEALLGDDASLLGPLLGWPPGRGEGAAAPPLHVLVESGPTSTFLFQAVGAVLGRLASPGAPLVVVLDDVHAAGPLTLQWVAFATRPATPVPLMVVAARRSGEGEAVAATETITLGPLDKKAAAAIVGDDRADDLHARSGGNPLFLVELASAEAGDDLPATILDAVSARCDEAGEAGATLRTAALLGPEVDLDLLAAVMQRPAVDLLEHLEEGVRRRFLEERGPAFLFRHEVVRQALMAGVPSTRAAFVHREAGRALAARPRPDPLEVAYHARLGGDEEVAAAALVDASRLAADRADTAAAEEILDQSLRLAPTAGGHVVRAQVRALRGRPAEAVEDARAALELGGGADALEVAGWASYWQRDWEAAENYAEDGARLATHDALRASCLTLAGRTRHARGDLAVAEDRFIEAIAAAQGPALAAASAWLGVLRSHQSRTGEALDLLRAATHMGGALGQVNVLLHALLFTGHAAALAGRTADALAALEQYTAEVDHRDVARFRGRGENFKGWVLRNLGATAEADDLTQGALETGLGPADLPELVMAAHLDLAEAALLRDDLDGAVRHLDAVAPLDPDRMVFGWRQRLKLRSHRARLALAGGDAAGAAELAEALAADSTGVPRYAVPARLLAARARTALGEPADRDAVAADLAELPRVVALEAWWLTAEVAHDLGVDDWMRLAGSRVDDLAMGAGPRGDAFVAHARRVLEGLQAR